MTLFSLSEKVRTNNVPTILKMLLNYLDQKKIHHTDRAELMKRMSESDFKTDGASVIICAASMAYGPCRTYEEETARNEEIIGLMISIASALPVRIHPNGLERMESYLLEEMQNSPIESANLQIPMPDDLTLFNIVMGLAQLRYLENSVRWVRLKVAI